MATHGTVTLDVHRAFDLVPLNIGKTSNPYATLTIGKSSYSTKVVEKTCFPEFQERFTFVGVPLPSVLQINLYNKLSFGGMDDVLGSATVTLFDNSRETKKNVLLSHGGNVILAAKAKSGCGSVELSYSVHPMSAEDATKAAAAQQAAEKAKQQQADLPDFLRDEPKGVPTGSASIGGGTNIAAILGIASAPTTAPPVTPALPTPVATAPGVPVAPPGASAVPAATHIPAAAPVPAVTPAPATPAAAPSAAAAATHVLLATPAPDERISPTSPRFDAEKAEDEAKRAKAMSALRVALVFCFFFMVAELVGGYVAHSLAILTDAAHLLTDVGGFAMALFSLQVASRAACSRYTYGWHRAEVVGTLASVFTIWALVGAILFEAVQRIFKMRACAEYEGERMRLLKSYSAKDHKALLELREPSCDGVDAPLMVIIGTLGLVVNMGCAFILSWGGHHGHSHGPHDHGHSHGGHEDAHQCSGHDDHHDREEHHGHSHEDDHGHSHHEEDHGHSHAGEDPESETPSKAPQKNLALNGAFLHALGDCVQSLGVIFAALFIWYFNKKHYGVPTHKYSIYNLADPASSLFFGVVTLTTTKALLKQLLAILMESTPEHVDGDKLFAELAAIEGVKSVHDLHVWSLTAEKTALSVHLVANNHDEVLSAAQEICEARFGISHTTIQVDPERHGSDRCSSNLH
jgi:zinc transporter 2